MTQSLNDSILLLPLPFANLLLTGANRIDTRTEALRNHSLTLPLPEQFPYLDTGNWDSRFPCRLSTRSRLYSTPFARLCCHRRWRRYFSHAKLFNLGF